MRFDRSGVVSGGTSTSQDSWQNRQGRCCSLQFILVLNRRSWQRSPELVISQRMVWNIQNCRTTTTNCNTLTPFAMNRRGFVVIRSCSLQFIECRTPSLQFVLGNANLLLLVIHPLHINSIHSDLYCGVVHRQQLYIALFAVVMRYALFCKEIILHGVLLFSRQIAFVNHCNSHQFVTKNRPTQAIFSAFIRYHRGEAMYISLINFQWTSTETRGFR